MSDGTHPEMAETITAHLAGLAAAPSLEVTQETADFDVHSEAAAAARRRCVGDEEFPFACGTINGVKCCSKCGATKTPQWREGPLGPKSLCNACGVKRTRKLRAEQEGGKRRRLTASPTKAPVVPRQPAASYAEPLHRGHAESYASMDLDSYDAFFHHLHTHYHHPQHHHATAAAPNSGASRRPQRRAAEEAAVRTARYAATGEWAAGGGVNTAGGSQLHWAAAAAAAQACEDTPTASGSGDSLPSSDCPEEVSWAPAAAAAGAAAWVASVPAPLDLDSCAAVDLLTIGMRRQEQQQHRRQLVCLPPAPALTSSPVASVAQSAADAEQVNHDVLLAMAAQASESEPVGAPHAVAPVNLPALSSLLPPNKVAELIRLNQELESAVHEAAACNAAVTAVAQVLAAKQAAALRAREAAVGATKRVRRFMVELDTQFGIQSKCQGIAKAKQQRTG